MGSLRRSQSQRAKARFKISSLVFALLIATCFDTALGGTAALAYENSDDDATAAVSADSGDSPTNQSWCEAFLQEFQLYGEDTSESNRGVIDNAIEDVLSQTPARPRPSAPVPAPLPRPRIEDLPQLEIVPITPERPAKPVPPIPASRVTPPTKKKPLPN